MEFKTTVGKTGFPRLSTRSSAIIAALTVVLVILASIFGWAFVIPREDWDEGKLVLHSYQYEYDVLISNASGPYEIILPVPLLRDGRVVPELDFNLRPKGLSELAQTPHGWGLRVTSDRALQIHLEGEVRSLRTSQSTDRGIPYLSTIDWGSTVPDVRTFNGVAWMYSNRTDLRVAIDVDVEMSRDWVTWYGMPTFSDAIGWQQELDCLTAFGWDSHPVYLNNTFIT